MCVALLVCLGVPAAFSSQGVVVGSTQVTMHWAEPRAGASLIALGLMWLPSAMFPFRVLSWIKCARNVYLKCWMPEVVCCILCGHKCCRCYSCHLYQSNLALECQKTFMGRGDSEAASEGKLPCERERGVVAGLLQHSLVARSSGCLLSRSCSCPVPCWATCMVGTLQMLKLQPLSSVITHTNPTMVFFFPCSQILVSLLSCVQSLAAVMLSAKAHVVAAW